MHIQTLISFFSPACNNWVERNVRYERKKRTWEEEKKILNSLIKVN